MTRIIVAGSRDFADKEKLYKVLNNYLSRVKDKVEIVSGHCRGADMFGEQYAKDHNIPVVVFPADWNTYGKRAGYIRNKQMAEYASEENGILIAFPIGEARGTKLMIKLAHEYDIATDVYYSLGQ